jgi:hypothetical protein
MLLKLMLNLHLLSFSCHSPLIHVLLPLFHIPLTIQLQVITPLSVSNTRPEQCQGSRGGTFDCNQGSGQSTSQGKEETNHAHTRSSNQPPSESHRNQPTCCHLLFTETHITIYFDFVKCYMLVFYMHLHALVS